jgi:hypothetical protein
MKVDNHKDAEGDRQPHVVELERQIIEGDIKHKKIQRKIERLKGTILLAIHDAERGDAAEENNRGSSSDGEDNGSDDDHEAAEPHRRSHHQQRRRPSELSYKLRDVASRATTLRYVGRKAGQLENLLTLVVGATTIVGNVCSATATRRRRVVIAVGRESAT